MKLSPEEKLKTIGIFQEGTSDQKIEIIGNFDDENLDNDVIESIANLIADTNKGVRNAATMLILNNGNPRFPHCIVQYVESSDISIRNLAGEILLKLGPLSIDPLIQFEHKNNDDTIKFIIDVLGLIGDQRSALFILGILSSSENDNVILACIEALGNLKYDDAMDVLMLFYERNELYKPTIVEALGKIGSKTALQFLMEHYSNEDEVTQYSILESLGSLGDVDTYFFLLEQLVTISGTLVLPLITSISLLKDKYDLDIPFDNRMKNLLMFTISEGTPEHRKIAFSLIDSFNDKDILCASLNLLGEDGELDDMVRSKIYKNAEYIYYEIARIIAAHPPNLKTILNLFLSIINYVTEYGYQLKVTMLELRNIVQAASGLLSNYDEEVRRVSMEIVFNLDPDSALLFIDTMVEDENTWNRLRLVEILESMHNQSVEPYIQKLSADEDEMVRDRALFALNLKVNHLSTNTN